MGFVVHRQSDCIRFSGVREDLGFLKYFSLILVLYISFLIWLVLFVCDGASPTCLPVEKRSAIVEVSAVTNERQIQLEGFGYPMIFHLFLSVPL